MPFLTAQYSNLFGGIMIPPYEGCGVYLMLNDYLPS